MTRQVSRRGDEPSSPDGAASSDDKQSRNSTKSALGRRALLTRGGVVAAGVVGAGAAGAIAAGSASAASGDPILQDTVNNAGTSATVTELDADNATTPAFILTNTGTNQDTVQGETFTFSGPNLRLTPTPPLSTVTNFGFAPDPNTSVGGDLTATYDGQLWFTHDFTQGGSPAGIKPAPVHTEQTANVYAGLPTPVRVLDTRPSTVGGRNNVINPSGNLGSGGLLSRKTIYINLDNLVYFADNVIANFTVTGPTGGGYLAVWSGSGGTPATSNIIWSARGVTLANLASSVVGSLTVTSGTTSTTYENVVAIYTYTTTQVIMDVLAFTMPGFEYAKGFSPAISAGNRAARLQRAQKKLLADKMRNAKRA
jgi:hypothetical protein